MKQGGWRKCHRWIGFVAAPFLLFAGVTGIIAGLSEIFSEEEEAREQARERISEVHQPVPSAVVSEPITKALTGAAARAPGAPVDKVLVDFKTDPPSVTVYLGRPAGGE